MCREYVNESVFISGGIDKQLVFWKHTTVQPNPDAPLSSVSEPQTRLTHLFSHRLSCKLNALCVVSVDGPRVTVASGGTLQIGSPHFSIQLDTFSLSD